MSRPFPFVRFELPGSLGIDDGRYPVRAHGEAETRWVLVARTAGAPPPSRRRRRKPKQADPETETHVPLTTLTVVGVEPLAEEPDPWLAALRSDSDRRDELIEDALGVVRRAIAARRVASAEPGIADPPLDSAVAIRVGYGSGDDLVDGRYTAALQVPLGSEPRRRRAALLRPQERLAAILGGRERPLACEELLLRARADIEAGRLREAALQLRVGLEALLAEREALAAPGQTEDLAALDEARGATGEAANAALSGELDADSAERVGETLAICERVLRRRAL